MVLFDHRSQINIEARGSFTADYPEEDDSRPETDDNHILIITRISRYSRSSKSDTF
jgi:hypothetical protein